MAIEEEDKSKTAFVMRKGLFQLKMMPFGLTCAPARLMETVLADLRWGVCLLNLEDIVIDITKDR